MLAIVALIAFFPFALTPYGEKEAFDRFMSPTSAHIFGTNDMGYDVWTELVHAAGRSLYIGVLSSLLSILLGSLFGMLGSLHPVLNGVIRFLSNVFLLLPRLLLLLVLASYLPKSNLTLILLIGFFSWPSSARLLSSHLEDIGKKDYVLALRGLGYSPFHIACRHYLPNVLPLLINRFLLGNASAILMESSLSFLGLGDTYHASWGSMMNFAFSRGAIPAKAFAYLLMPGIMIAFACLSFFFLSEYVSIKEEEISSGRF